MNFKDHVASHLRLDGRIVVHAAILLAIVAAAHAATLTYEDSVLAAIARRGYYVPVIYAALAFGMLAAIIIALLGAGAHLAIMFYSMGKWNGLSLDHGIELIFLISVGALTGALQDHFRHVREKERLTSDMFGKYISPEVAQLVTEQDEALQGKEVRATVLFADLTGMLIQMRLDPQPIRSHVYSARSFNNELVTLAGKNSQIVNGDLATDHLCNPACLCQWRQ